jgi:hypothetical protein
MDRPHVTRVALFSVVALGAAGGAVLAPWGGGSAWTASSGQAGSTTRSASALMIDPPATVPALAALPLTPTATPTLAEAPQIAGGQVQIDVAYHSQQDPDWCDPADIEMWLQADGIALPGSDDYSIQQQFWTYELDNNDGYTVDEWNASPYAVAATLDYYGGWNDIGDDPQPSADAAGAVITYSLDVLQQPVIVMVGGGTHYVLITGAQLSDAGIGAPPLTVTVDDPLAYGVGAAAPAGSDGSYVIDWDDFTGWYTANTSHGGIWAGQWVIIAAGLPLVG